VMVFDEMCVLSGSEVGPTFDAFSASLGHQLSLQIGLYLLFNI
jgi:hypothetical protein